MPQLSVGLLEPDGDTLPRACHMVKPEDGRAVLTKLLECDMICFVKCCDVQRTMQGRAIVGGLLCVSHKPHSYRLLNDRRPP